MKGSCVNLLERECSEPLNASMLSTKKASKSVIKAPPPPNLC